MSVDAQKLGTLIEHELASVRDDRVVSHIRDSLVSPYAIMRDWDYGFPGQQYPCWMVLRDKVSGAEIGYCESGFGPRSPWGLVGSGSDARMGMDSGWFETFMDAFFDSSACVALPIWRVFRSETGNKLIPITNEDTWEATWKLVENFRRSESSGRYDCSHSIGYGDDMPFQS